MFSGSVFMVSPTTVIHLSRPSTRHIISSNATICHKMQLFSSPPDTSSISLHLHRSNSSNFQSSSSRPNLCRINSRTLKMERFWALTSGFSSNKDLVAHLQRSGMIRSNKVAQVMKSVDRGLFLPNEKPFYVDSPSDIGYNATISAPHMHASCLQLLEKHLQPGMRALDVGSGSGYLTACFGLMVGPQGRVVGVEHIPELVASSIQNIQNSSAAPLLEQGTIHLRVGDGRLGWAEFAPYDAIHVGAAAAAEIPHPLLDQLKPGGRMIIPVGKTFQELEVVDKKPDGTIVVQEDATVRYVPLTNREAQLQDY